MFSKYTLYARSAHAPGRIAANFGFGNFFVRIIYLISPYSRRISLELYSTNMLAERVLVPTTFFIL